jgi:hypothetical protein
VSFRLSNVDEAGHLYGTRGGSGGYTECIFRYAALRLFGKELGTSLNFKTLRNSDFKELILEVKYIVLLFQLPMEVICKLNDIWILHVNCNQ